MQELTQKEIKQVNGGGFITDLVLILWEHVSK